MKKRFVAGLMSVVLVMGLLAGCGNQKGNAKTTKKSVGKKAVCTVQMNKNFNESLIKFLEDNGYKDKNYMVSPTSFRAALALAVEGAAGVTREELLKAMGFESMEEIPVWYDSVQKSVDRFYEYADDYSVENMDYRIQNSIWNNSSQGGDFSKKYIKEMTEKYNATAENATSNEITDKVNNWVKEGTNGLIPVIADNLSIYRAVLVNTLYLRTAWENNFWIYGNENFNTYDGKKVKKDYMQQEEEMRYYEDENGKLVVVPMEGNIDAVFILGDVKNVAEKISKASYCHVTLRVPQFEAETSFESKELINYLQSLGVETAFNMDADFSNMYDEAEVYIEDIVQKTKIKADENGIEAAAATAIMCDAAAAEMSEEKEFIADQPFRYMLTTDDENAEVLFYGQVVE
ncbi:MAG: hypothetical protein K6G65_05010 [Lachnospiraceae bacterium]|nr:hypothetical protein [Lachnospiraceae bacterium]